MGSGSLSSFCLKIPAKELKAALGASKNKFEVLTSIDPENLLLADDGKKQRAASLGVSKLVQDLKLKKKEQLDKVKKMEDRGGTLFLSHYFMLRKIINWATSCHISILCLLETRVKEINSADILNRSFSDWDSYCNYNHAVNGRIWVLWHKYLACSVISAYDQSVSIKGSFEGQSFCVTAVHGLNDGNARRHLWNQLISLDIVNLPWLIGGDFNIILNPEESSGSINTSTLADISDFRSCVENLGGFDHSFTGPLLTWSNKQQDSYLARKLDRVLVNSAWIDAFPESDVEFLAPGDSDHCPAVVWLRKAAPVPVEGNPAQVLFQKLKRLKCPLRYLNKSHFNDISNQVKLKREELMRIQLANLSAGSIVNDEMQAERELHSLEEAEMLFYKQKAKVSWINEGDQGTRFFHSVVASKRKSSTIMVLFDQSGTRLDTFDDMANEVIKFFQYQLGTTDANVKGCSTATIKDLLNYSLPLGADTVLCRDVSDVEIRKALWGQGNDKSPGPDGYNPFFYKVAWPIIGDDFTTAVRYCFENSFILPAFNSTAVVLVPKVPNPSLVKDFRPISCCTVIYKTITRILVKRLSAVFPDMVTKNQTAFVKERSIVDNTLLAQEIVRGYNRKNISPRCTLKIDLQKASTPLIGTSFWLL
ncbi:uncharacterized protein LOC120161268 [Hibiscus syriacus]|uniref:uncharacterized protein LOC120161268 n=1 Tax=Hibiscus syriacus TaxID=106335 RepID=UPI0019219968|nr:uncharacterized protein LOC120161268 [Hibiscus syriacus]